MKALIGILLCLLLLASPAAGAPIEVPCSDVKCLVPLTVLEALLERIRELEARVKDICV